MLSILLAITLLAACGEIDNNPADGGTDGDTGTGDGGTTWDGGTEDGGTDTGTGDGGTEVTKGNCGGREPPPESWWICEDEDGGNWEGYTWPHAGVPENIDECVTTADWTYEISEDGNSVVLTRTDGWVLICELDE